MTTISLEQFRASINLAADRAELTSLERERLLELGPGRYALGAYTRGCLDCPVEAVYHLHRGPVKEGQLDGYYGTPLAEFAHRFDRLHRGNVLEVTP